MWAMVPNHRLSHILSMLRNISELSHPMILMLLHLLLHHSCLHLSNALFHLNEFLILRCQLEYKHVNLLLELHQLHQVDISFVAHALIRSGQISWILLVIC